MSIALNGDVEIYYETFGEVTDSPVLLVNGLGSQCISYRTAFCEQLAGRGYFVIRFDNRDAGLSTKFDHFELNAGDVLRALAAHEKVDVPYLLRDMALDACAVLDALGIDRAHALGASMGAMIVQTLAIEFPDRLLTMVSIMSTTGDLDVGRPTGEARAVLLAPPPGDRDAFVERRLAGAGVWGSASAFDPDQLATEAHEAFDRSFCPLGVTRQFVAIQASGSRTADLRTLSTPTLVIHGDADTLIDLSGGQRTRDVIPGAQLEIIAGMGHDLAAPYWGTLIDLFDNFARSRSGEDVRP